MILISEKKFDFWERYRFFSLDELREASVHDSAQGLIFHIILYHLEAHSLRKDDLIQDDLKIIWKQITPDRYRVPKFGQPKERRQNLFGLNLEIFNFFYHTLTFSRTTWELTLDHKKKISAKCLGIFYHAYHLQYEKITITRYNSLGQNNAPSNGHQVPFFWSKKGPRKRKNRRNSFYFSSASKFIYICTPWIISNYYSFCAVKLLSMFNVYLLFGVLAATFVFTKSVTYSYNKTWFVLFSFYLSLFIAINTETPVLVYNLYSIGPRMLRFS